MNITEIVEKIEAAGLSAKVWNNERVYVEKSGKKLGYLVDGDDGTTGTCENIFARSGEVAAALRK